MHTDAQTDWLALVAGTHDVEPIEDETIQERFTRFHHENPHIYAALVRLARQARAAGAHRIGIGMLFEVLRWNVLVVTTGSDFKLNNNYRSRYARLISEREPDLREAFETRELKAA